MANFGTVGIIAEAKNFGATIAAMSQFRRQVGVLASAQQNLNRANTASRTGARGFLGAITGVSGGLASFGQSIRNVGTDIKGLGNEIAAVGFRLGFLIGLPIISTLAAITKEAAAFEKSLVGIVNLTDASSQAVIGWRDELLTLAPALGRTPAELAEGLFAVTSAGITDTTLAMETLTAAAKASAIGLGETGTIAREVGGIINAYGAENISAAQATDMLVAIVDQGNLEIDQLAGQMGRVTGLGATMGISFDQLGAFVATYSRSNVGASVAVSSLRAALSAIQNPTNEAMETLAKFGITIGEVHEAIADPNIGLARVLIALTAVFGEGDAGMDDIIGSARGLGGVLFNTGAIAQQYLQIQDNIAESAGITEEGFARLASTTSFMADQARASIGVLGTALGQILLPSINSLLQAVVPLVQGFAAWAALNPQLVRTATLIGLTIAALGPLLVIAGLLVSSVGTLIAVFGGLITVVAKAAVPIALLGGAFSLLSGKVVESAKDTQAKGSKHFAGVANQARGWGHNIVVQLARGIAEATIVVVRALIRLGNIISGWLAPGSPPKLLPDLTDWGAAWMTELFRGFTLADFSVFNDLASLVESFLRSLGTDAIAEDGLVPAILGSRSAIAEAIEQMRTLGFVTQDVLARISGAFGDTSLDIQAYVMAMLRLEDANEAVADAQQRLNDIEREFDNIISPLQDELDAIGDQQQEWAEDQRIAELQQILAQHGDDPIVRERVLAELRAIELQRQIRAQENLRDAAVETAEAELEAAQTAQELAQEQVNTQQALIQAQIDNNNLLQEQIALLERLAEALDGAGGGAGDLDTPIGGGGGLGDALANLDDLLTGIEEFTNERGINLDQFLRHNVDEPIDEAISSIDDFATQLQELIDSIKAEFDPLVGEDGLFAQLKESWAGAFTAIAGATGNLGTTIATHGHTINGFLYGLSAVLLILGGPSILAGLTKLGTTLATIIGGFTLASAGMAAFLVLLVAAPTLMGAAIDKYGSFGEVLREAGKAILYIAGIFGILIKEVGRLVLLKITEWSLEIVNDFEKLLGAIKEDFGVDLATFFRETLPKILREGLVAFTTWIGEIIVKFVELAYELVGGSIIPDMVMDIVDWFGKELPARVLTAIDLFVTSVKTRFLTAGEEFVGKIIEGVGNMLESLKQAFINLLTSAWAAATGSVNLELPSIGGGSGGGLGSGGPAGGSSGNPTPSGGTGGSSGGGGGTGQIPQFAAPVVASPLVSGGVTNIFNNNVSNGMDAASLVARIRRVVRQEVG